MPVASRDDQVMQRLLTSVSDSEIVDLEKALVGIPSYTGEESDLAEYIVQFLRENDVSAELQEVPLSEHFGAKTSRRVSHNVVGRLAGDGTGPSLMFNGHMDHGPWAIGQRVVDDFSTWIRSPFEPTVEGGLVYGKGAQDEKGGICAMLGAAISLRRAGIRLRGDVYFCPVMGHKTHSLGTKSLLALGLRTDFGVNTENSGNWIVPVHVGIITAEVVVKGANPRLRWRPDMAAKAGAFENAIRLIDYLGPEGRYQEHGGWLSFQPHPILINRPVHRISYLQTVAIPESMPGHTVAVPTVKVGIFVSIVPGQDEITVRRDLQELVQRIQADHSDFEVIDITTEQWGPPLETPLSSPIVQTLKRWENELTGQPARVGSEGRMGGSAYGCGALMAAAGIQTVIYGPGDHAVIPAHRPPVDGELPPDESISVADLVRATRVMALTAYSLCG